MTVNTAGSARNDMLAAPAAGSGQPEPGLPAGVDSVLAVLSSSAVVLDRDDKVLRASAAARSFGLVDGDELVVGDLVALARKVRRDGKVREGEIGRASCRERV